MVKYLRMEKVTWATELCLCCEFIRRVSWPCGLEHLTRGVGSNPGHATCVLEQDTLLVLEKAFRAPQEGCILPREMRY